MANLQLFLGILGLCVAFSAPVSAEVTVSHDAHYDVESVDAQDALPDSWGAEGA